jgi:hypothetical protein
VLWKVTVGGAGSARDEIAGPVLLAAVTGAADLDGAPVRDVTQLEQSAGRPAAAQASEAVVFSQVAPRNADPGALT